MDTASPFRRLPLDGTNNTRDLGGYPCPDGQTRWHSFFRSDRPSTLSERDLATLRTYGLTTAVDLRSENERKRRPTLLCSANGFEAYNVPIEDELLELDYEGDVPGSMAGYYIGLMDSAQKGLGRVFTALAEAKGACLFNCSMGKDRTGVVAMLLLELAGVAWPDIVADYAITDIYMTELINEHLAEGAPAHIFRSQPASMHRALRHLQEAYGGAGGYLRAIGISAGTIKALKERLVRPATERS